MARPALRTITGVIAVAGALGACDRVAQQWPFRSPPSSVTVKLPPPRIASPGFAFNDRRKTAPTEIH
jgi:hypothetical protein